MAEELFGRALAGERENAGAVSEDLVSEAIAIEVFLGEDVVRARDSFGQIGES